MMTLLSIKNQREVLPLFSHHHRYDVLPLFYFATDAASRHIANNHAYPRHSGHPFENLRRNHTIKQSKTPKNKGSPDKHRGFERSQRTSIFDKTLRIVTISAVMFYQKSQNSKTQVKQFNE
jgi:hypothetical protein